MSVSPRSVEIPDVVVQMPKVLRPVTAVRSTIVCASLLGLAEEGLKDAYLERLPSEHHAAIAALTAGQWIPVELAMEHYRACDRLEVDDASFERMFRNADGRLRGTTLSTVASLSTALGLGPWLPLRQYARTWERLFLGGGVGVLRLGAHVAQVEARGLPLLRVRYFAKGMRLLHVLAYERFCAQVAVDTYPGPDAESLLYRVRWR
ncbi:MAG: hypothetical protein HOO96_20420 [Polyangiaceae bacterium]|nr:hypothetical protein [Polyangiaceae bacterium]